MYNRTSIYHIWDKAIFGVMSRSIKTRVQLTPLVYSLAEYNGLSWRVQRQNAVSFYKMAAIPVEQEGNDNRR